VAMFVNVNISSFIQVLSLCSWHNSTQISEQHKFRMAVVSLCYEYKKLS